MRTEKHTGFIDLHCDTLLAAAVRGEKSAFRLPGAMLDGERLISAGGAGQFFAIFFPPSAGIKKLCEERGVDTLSDTAFFDSLYGIFQNTINDAGGALRFVKSAAEFKENQKSGAVSAFLTLEDGRIIDGSMEKLRLYFEKGIRLISLTWNGENSFGYPNSPVKEDNERGLKPFGIDAVREMNELGIIVDVSHLSDGGFWDVAKHSKKPFVASHSNARALCSHPRNLSDEMIKAVANGGGVIGVNFCPQFLEDGSTAETADMLIRHLKYLIKLGGEDIAALGSDFDGIGGELEIGSVEKIPILIEKLRASLGARAADKAAQENAARVIADILH